jgi:hypothetical protein
MAEPTEVNPQITDLVKESEPKGQEKAEKEKKPQGSPSASSTQK